MAGRSGREPKLVAGQLQANRAPAKVGQRIEVHALATGELETGALAWTEQRLEYGRTAPCEGAEVLGVYRAKRS